MKKVSSYAALSAKTPLAPLEIERRDIGSRDIGIEILYCGICHSDLHTARNEWKGTTFPAVPGHEIVGRVAQVGKDVTSFKVGDLCAVGCLVDSCRQCVNCKDHLEQYCEGPATFTYNSPDKHTGKTTYGGYSNYIVVDKDFVLRISDKLDLAGVAPLLCAGITVYSPLHHWKVKKGQKVGVVGLGGLGHMAVKIAHAMGAHVTMFTSSQSKVADAKKLGADEVVITKEEGALKKLSHTFDFILNTVAASHDINAYLQLLKRDGTMCLVGAPEHPHPPTDVSSLIFFRRQLAGSLIGGIKETQEMLDFCAKHGITADVEVIPIDKVNEAYERMLKSDVKYRFVIDMSTLPKPKK
jgi:uncharacterized zinc-type alcohol dehydrogenase-like protein